LIRRSTLTVPSGGGGWIRVAPYSLFIVNYSVNGKEPDPARGQTTIAPGGTRGKDAEMYTGPTTLVH